MARSKSDIDQDHTPDGKRGFALVAAIWLAGLMVVVATEVSTQFRQQALIRAAGVSELRLEAAAAGLVRLVAYQLTEKETYDRSRTCFWDDDISAAIVVQDHAGLVDLNAAPLDLLQGFLTGTGASPTTARAIAADIVDYRDIDTVKVDLRAEMSTRGGHTFRNAPFLSEMELDGLPSMTETIYRSMLPYVTTLSGLPFVDPSTMDPGLRAAMKKALQSNPQFREEAYFGPSSKRSFRIGVTTYTSKERHHRIVADIVILDRLNNRFEIVSWIRSSNIAATEGRAAQRCFS